MWEVSGIVTECQERKGVSEKTKKPYSFWSLKVATLGFSAEIKINEDQGKKIGAGQHLVCTGDFEEWGGSLRLILRDFKPYAAPRGGVA